MNVTVTTQGGGLSTGSSGGISVALPQFTYIPAPVVTALNPASGPLAGGETIAIDGNYFGDVTTGVGDVTGVQFGNGPLITPLSDTYYPARHNGLGYFPAYWELTVKVPKSGSGTLNVTVTTASGGPSSPTSADVFSYLPIPVLSLVTPQAGPLAGTNTVLITGNYLGGDSVGNAYPPNSTTVYFGGNAGTIDSDVEAGPGLPFWVMTATVPPGSAGTVNVTVTTPGGTSVAPPVSSTDPDAYAYTSRPIVQTVSPSVGTTAGQPNAAIYGYNLLGATAVSFGGTPATNLQIVDSVEIMVTIPPHAAGTVNVTVTTPGGQSLQTDQYTYLTPPSIDRVTPNIGPFEGETTVSIQGTNFAGADTKVYFGGTAGTIIQNLGTEIFVTTPFHYVGQVDVTVATTAGTSLIVPADEFTFGVVPPVVNEVSPATGAFTGGTPVNISGANLQYPLGVYFGGIPASSYTSISDTQLEATSPSGTAGNVDVTVKTADGTSQTSPSDLFDYLPVPSITGVSPSSGSTYGGTTVTITGTNLMPVNVVDFGFFPGTMVFDSPTEIIETTRPQAAGTVNVATANQYGPSAISMADEFTFFVPGPVVTGLTNNSGNTAGGTPVTISGENLANIEAVDFGATPANPADLSTIVYNPNGSITIDSPPSPGNMPGSVDVTVMTAGGTSPTSSADLFTYGSTPTITFMEPKIGPAGVNDFAVYLDGANLTNTADPSDPSSGVIVQFGSADGGISTDQADAIGCAPPPEGPGTVTVRVFTPSGGWSTSTPTADNQFTFIPGPFVIGAGGWGTTTGGAR